MRENGHTISEWARGVFGEYKRDSDVTDRAASEWEELRELVELGGDPEKIAVEVADFMIVLCQLPARYGIDVFKTIDQKMHVNRKRKWRVDGAGFGQHVEEGE